MKLNQGKVAQGLVDDLLDKIHEYDDTLYMSPSSVCWSLSNNN